MRDTCFFRVTCYNANIWRELIHGLLSEWQRNAQQAAVETHQFTVLITGLTVPSATPRSSLEGNASAAVGFESDGDAFGGNDSVFYRCAHQYAVPYCLREVLIEH